MATMQVESAVATPQCPGLEAPDFPQDDVVLDSAESDGDGDEVLETTDSPLDDMVMDSSESDEDGDEELETTDLLMDDVVLDSSESDEDEVPAIINVKVPEMIDDEMPDIIDDEVPAITVIPVAKIVVEMMKETNFEPNSKNHAFYGLNETLFSPLHAELAAQRTDWPEWYSARHMYYAAIPSGLARAEFVKQLVYRHKKWILNDWEGGNVKVLDYACRTGLTSQALSSHVSHIVGIDEDQAMVRMYNEIMKRQGHPTCTMEAFAGDLIGDFQTGKIPGFVDKGNNGLEMFKQLDLVVIAFGLDSFETPDLSATQRYRQLLASLRAIVNRLRDHGTLLIIDVEKTDDLTPPATVATTPGGYKTTGYHRETLKRALNVLCMTDIETIANERFKWQATEKEKKTWGVEDADEVLYMMRARNGLS